MIFDIKTRQTRKLIQNDLVLLLKHPNIIFWIDL